MDATERARCFRQLVRDVSWPSLIKSNVSTAINAADDWADSNATSFNTALPEPFKSTANASQKALLLAYICLRRAGIFNVSDGWE